MPAEEFRFLGLPDHERNFVFVGEAGSGKSEVAMTFARKLAERSPLPVHFFDLDMTKPLFRSRDAAAKTITSVSSACRVPPPQAVRDSAIASARNRAVSLRFIVIFPPSR